jgi:SpoIID/LytB domain protein
MSEPRLRVGLLLRVPAASFTLEGPFDLSVDGGVSAPVPSGAALTARAVGGVRLEDAHRDTLAEGRAVRLVPRTPDANFVVRDFRVGAAFHWEHAEDLRFSGGIDLVATGDVLDLVNEVPLEQYVESVICSEMSAACPASSLRAHAIISRSWLLAQLASRPRAVRPGQSVERGRLVTRVLWYDRQDHDGFDVCADDHCQRYQGVTRAVGGTPAEAVRSTRGLALVHGGEVCDARFSKCCGGATEVFPTCWGDEDRPYLQAFADRPGEHFVPLDDEARAQAHVLGHPNAWCNTTDQRLLERILPTIDRGTRDFWRWTVTLEQEEARELVRTRAGVDTGPIRALTPLRRGPSGRIFLLEIDGRDRTLHLGKELEIRRVLSASHLYSSAFVVSAEGPGEIPDRFVLRGAGWGHGVGLCQIGAAVMAERGHDHEDILAHYYRGATVDRLY